MKYWRYWLIPLMMLAIIWLFTRLTSAQVSGGGVSWAPPVPGPLRAQTAAFGGGLLAVGACASTTTSVPSATTSMVVDTTPVTYPNDGAVWFSYVSSAGVVTTKVCVLLALAPASTAYNLAVWQ
jgi:hypothetical protein